MKMTVLARAGKWVGLGASGSDSAAGAWPAAARSAHIPARAMAPNPPAARCRNRLRLIGPAWHGFATRANDVRLGRTLFIPHRPHGLKTRATLHQSTNRNPLLVISTRASAAHAPASCSGGDWPSDASFSR